MILLAIGIAALVISLLHCFFGYRLARFLLPVCGVLLIEGALYIFVYKSLMLDTMGTWLFFAGTGLSSYFVLFFFQRIAAFFTGLTGAALFLVFVVYAFSLHTLPFLYPIGMTLCVLCGLIAAVYRRVGVAVFSALFGGCAAAYAGLYLFFEGIEAEQFLFGNLLLPIEMFLSSNALMICGVAAALTIAGIAVQIKLTGLTQVLKGRFRNGAGSNKHSNMADMV